LETVIKTSIFIKNNSSRRHFMVALVVALAIFYADLARAPSAVGARQAIYSLLEPAYLAMAMPGHLVEQISESIRLGAALQEENNQLRKQNLLYAAELQRIPHLVGENAELRRLNEAELDVPAAVRLVEVIGVDPDPSRRILIIRNEPGVKLYRGQPVLDANGVMGRIHRIGRQTARVILLTDRTHSVPVRVNRTGIRAILNGTGDAQELSLQFVPEKSDIKVGDLLTTSGLGNDFPAGYPVARITKIRRLGDDQFLDITARPIANLDRSRFLLALFDRPASNILLRPEESQNGETR
jgi:rod shape-determining protein MreC